MNQPLIVTAELGPSDLAWLNALRQRHFPPERNQLSAHLTMFHALPAFAEDELRRRLALLAELPPPGAMISGLMELGRGVAYRIVSDELDAIRDELKQAMQGLLTAQDSGGWVPHVTIQNKVDPRVAKALKKSLEVTFTPRPIAIPGLGLHRYCGGPWERVRTYAFRGR